MRLLRVLLACLCAVLAMGTVGCGFVLRQEAIPEMLPTTTAPLSNLPEGAPADGAGAFPMPLDVEGIDGIIEAPTTTLPPPDYLQIREDALRVSPNASRLCRLGAMAVYYGTNVLAVALDESGGLAADADEAEVREELRGMLAVMREVAPLVAESDTGFSSPRQLRELLDGFEQVIEQDVPGEPLMLRYRLWWAEHAELLSELTGALAIECREERFTQGLDSWR